MPLPESKPALLEVEGLSVQLQSGSTVNQAVVDASFSVPVAARVGMVGESGSGKSVSALSVLRLHDPRLVEYGRSSRVVFEGRDLLRLPLPAVRALRGAQISMVFQDPASALNPVMRIGHQIEQVIRTHRDVRRPEARRETLESLARVHLPDPERVAASYPHQLSGGMLQRSLVAMAIACRPRLLIADEPTSALDVTVQAGVLSTFVELSEALRMSLLLITHDMAVISRSCDTVYVMYGGRVVEGGPTAAVLNHPRHPYTQLLLRCQPSIEGEIPRRLPTIGGVQGSRPVGSDVPGCSFAARCPWRVEACSLPQPMLPVAEEPSVSVACHRWREIASGESRLSPSTGPAGAVPANKEEPL
ncbi:MAG TPA: ABC transporter ATP-binding protein [Acidimicrobiales bacterium]|nr:ABC transporter ATP-binding protein [Acidimicrobiales bacterium]